MVGKGDQGAIPWENPPGYLSGAPRVSEVKGAIFNTHAAQNSQAGTSSQQDKQITGY